MKKLPLILLILLMLPLISAVNPISNLNCNYPSELIDTKNIDCSFTSSSSDKFSVFFIFTINDTNNGTIEQGEFNISSAFFDDMPLTSVYNATYENYNNSWAITNNSKEINITKGQHKLNITLNISERADADNYTLGMNIVSGLYLLSLPEETASSWFSGGGGSSFSRNILNLDSASKIEINVREGDSIFFLFNKKIHTLKLNRIQDNKTLITISSNLTSFWLEIGNEWAVNLDGKMIYAGLMEINNKTALISLNKEPKATMPTIQEPEVNKTEKKEVKKEPIEKEVRKMLLWLVIVIASLLLIYIVMRPNLKKLFRDKNATKLN